MSNTMELNIKSLIGETTAYDKKQVLEVRRPKSWLKSVSAFANGEGGTLIFGISDDDQILGLADAEGDAEKISEEIKSKLDPVPTVRLELKETDGKKLALLQVYPGQETPYYYIGDKQRLAFVRIGNESVVADRIQLKSLVLKGAGKKLMTACLQTTDLRIWLLPNSGLFTTKGCNARLMTANSYHGESSMKTAI